MESTTTFLATGARRVNAVKLAQLSKLEGENSRYWIAKGTPERNQAAYVLCFDGAREHADQAVIARFREIVSA